MAIYNPSYRDQHRPLMSALSMLVLFSVALAILAVLESFVLDREERAEQVEPSSLSLMYLRLGLQYRPDDAHLRLQVARAHLAAGRLDETHELLKPLLAVESKYNLEARVLNVELDFKTWASVEPGTLERSAAQHKLIGAIDSLKDAELDAADAKRLADLARQMGQPAYAAEILTNLAWRGGLKTPETEQYLASADKIYLEAGQPMQAAKLHLAAIEKSEGARRQQHALSALERARSADRPEELLAMLKTLVKRFPDDQQLLSMAVVLAKEVGDLDSAAQYGRLLLALAPEEDSILSDQIANELAIGQVQRAFSLAQVKLERHPEDAQNHRQVAELALWSGQPLRALDEYTWLAYFRGDEEDRTQALNLAKAYWDQSARIKLMQQAPRRGPLQAEELVELVKLYESIGEGGEALRLLQQELRGPLAQDHDLWSRQVAIQLRLNQVPAAAETLTSIAQRFGQSDVDATLYADLLVRLGRSPEALTALKNASSDRIEHHRRVAELAWSLDQIQDAATAYATIALRPEATSAEFIRLAHLQRKLGNDRDAITTATETWERFNDPSMLRFAMATAFEAGDYDRLAPLLDMAQKDGSEFTASPDYWRLRVSFYQQLAQRAAAGGDYQRVRGLLDHARLELSSASDAAPIPDRTYAALWHTQNSQELNLALQTNDNVNLKRLYDSGAISPTPRESVFILHRLERDPQAIRVALQEIQSQNLSDTDREALTVDANSLAQDIPRHVWVQTDVSTLQGLRSWHTEVGTVYSWDGGGLSGSAAYTNLERLNNAVFPLDQNHEVAVKLSGRLAYGPHESIASLGIDMLNGESPRPSGVLEQRLHILKDGQLSVRAAVNEVGNETAGMKVFGVRDQVALGANVPIGEIFIVNAVASGEQFLTRDRQWLGNGLTADVGTGVRFRLSAADNANVRVATHLAYRQSNDKIPTDVPIDPSDKDSLVPKSSTWVGVAATVARGQIGAPRPAGRGIKYIVDVSGGWLWPMNEFGYLVSAGIGFEVFGRDEISIAANAGNFSSSSPGDMVWGLNVKYAESLWR